MVINVINGFANDGWLAATLFCITVVCLISDFSIQVCCFFAFLEKLLLDCICFGGSKFKTCPCSHPLRLSPSISLCPNALPISSLVCSMFRKSYMESLWLDHNQQLDPLHTIIVISFAYKMKSVPFYSLPLFLGCLKVDFDSDYEVTWASELRYQLTRMFSSGINFAFSSFSLIFKLFCLIRQRLFP